MSQGRLGSKPKIFICYYRFLLMKICFIAQKAYLQSKSHKFAIPPLYSISYTKNQSQSTHLYILQSSQYNMLVEKPYRSQIKVKFHFPNEPSSKIAQTSVNPFVPLLNYKGIIESGTRLDLYGRKIHFKYKHNEDSYKIEYLQDIAVKTKMPLKNDIDVQVFIDQMGG